MRYFTGRDFDLMRDYLLDLDEEGFSWELKDFEDVKGDFWMVGGASKEIIIESEDLLSPSLEVRIPIIKKINNLINEDDFDESHALGGWIDNQGRAVIEISFKARSTMRAILRGLSLNQSSIYHIQRRESIDLNLLRDYIKGGEAK